jgi:hypothetical protein
MCFEHDIAWTSSWQRLIYVWWTRHINLFHEKLYVLRDIQYGPLPFFLIVLYLILKTISFEQLTTERQGYKFLTVYTCTEINPFHDGPVAENTTEQVNWYFSSAVVSSWKGLPFIIRVFFRRYSVEITVSL